MFWRTLLFVIAIVLGVTELPCIVAQETQPASAESDNAESDNAEKETAKAGSEQETRHAETAADAKSHAAEGSHAGHHDDPNLSHQNAGPQLEDPSEFRSDLAIWTF